MIKLVISLLISLLLLYFSLRQIDFGQALTLISSANPLLIVFSILVHFAAFYLRTIRWGVLLSKLKHVSTGTLFPLVAVGYMANNVLPFRLGELVRSQLLGREAGISRGSVLSTILVERMFDAITLVILLLLFFLIFPVPQTFKVLTIVIGVALVLGFAFLVSLMYIRESVSMKSLILKLPLVNHPFTRKIANSVILGLEVLRRPTLVINSLMLSIISWLLEGFMVYLIALSVNLPVNYLQIIFLTSVINIATLIPSSPGYFGTFEFFTWHALEVFGIEKTQAVTFAALVHIIQWLPITVVGYLYSFRYNFSFKSLGRDKES